MAQGRRAWRKERERLESSHCIISAERVVNLDQIHATLYQHNKERIEKSAIKPNLIRYAETSMKTGFGLKYIYDYLAVPFLQLQVSNPHFELRHGSFN